MATPKIATNADGVQSAPKTHDANDPSIQEVYADDAYIWLTNSGASLLFGNVVPVGAPGKTFKPNVRVHMTHEVLYRLSMLLDGRAKALNELYGGPPPSLSTKDPKEIAKAIKDNEWNKA
jgi:hypothetical protein